MAATREVWSDRGCGNRFPRQLSLGAAGMPKWRNWQTRRTQNPVPFTRGGGSIPPFGTTPSLGILKGPDIQAPRAVSVFPVLVW